MVHGVMGRGSEDDVDQARHAVVLAGAVAPEHDQGVGCGLIGHHRPGRTFHREQLASLG